MPDLTEWTPALALAYRSPASALHLWQAKEKRTPGVKTCAKMLQISTCSITKVKFTVCFGSNVSTHVTYKNFIVFQSSQINLFLRPASQAD